MQKSLFQSGFCRWASKSSGVLSRTRPRLAGGFVESKEVMRGPRRFFIRDPHPQSVARPRHSLLLGQPFPWWAMGLSYVC